MALTPRLVLADKNGKIFDHPSLLMGGRRSDCLALPKSGELLPLPPESELFLLPGRAAFGYDPVKEEWREAPGQAIAAFPAPAYTLSAHPAFIQEACAPVLPLFAYGAVGYARGKFWIWAERTDTDKRQVFKDIDRNKIDTGCRRLLADFSQNRLIAHIINKCVRVYDCPAARNFALGRYEAPLPTSRVCNARCLGCISSHQPDSPVKTTPQCRLDFTPNVSEIVEVMAIHESREKKCPVYSFGQGCEGEPLMNAPLLAESIRLFRRRKGQGTINCNSNASRPDDVAMLAEAGLTSLRISMNSARAPLYEAYYNPVSYNFSDVAQSARTARKMGVFVSINFLWFPGITDTAEELDALVRFCAENGVSMIQWRNLNIDPVWYLDRMRLACPELIDGSRKLSLGLKTFMLRLKERCPWLRYGYFNPWLGSKASLLAPEV